MASAFFTNEPYFSDGNDDDVSVLEPSRVGSRTLELSWRSVSYSVVSRVNMFPYVPFLKKSGPELQILSGISGECQAGQLCALMGPSGAGKSSLLDVLAHRKTSGEVNGQLFLNGSMYSKKAFTRIGSYVVQSDVMYGALTVRESLLYACRLSGLEDRYRRVDELIRQLQLEDVANSKVGDELIRGISGGEKRRVSIGMELVSDPQVILLDEPTSGLDASSAFVVVNALHNLARSGKIVIMTIHQPTAKIYQLFDKLMLLHNGEPVYFGEAQEALVHFESTLGIPCDDWADPADWLMDAISPDADAEDEEAEARTKAENVQILKEAHRRKGEPDMGIGGSMLGHRLPTLRKQNVFGQFFWLLHRHFTLTRRNHAILWSRLSIQVFTGVLLALMYLRIGSDQISITDRLGLLFWVPTELVIQSIPTLPIFVSDRAVFMRERASGWYGALPAFLSVSTVQIPIVITVALTISVLVYFPVGLHLKYGQGFSLFLITMILLSFLGDSICMAISAISPNLELANALVSAVIGFFGLFGGFFINLRDIPIWYVWAKWVSFFHFGFRAICINEFEGLHFHCDKGQHVVVNGTSICPVTSGHQVLEELDFLEPSFFGNMWGNVIPLVIWIAVLRLIAFLALKYLKPGVKT